MRAFPSIAAAAIIPALAVSGCGADQPASTGGAAGASSTVTVFAAASMKTTFTKLAKSFEAAHPGVTVAFNFAGSQALADQLTQGARADAFASANESNMTTVTAANLNAGPARLYATNTLSIAVPPDNPARVTAFADLARPGLKVVVCAPAVPCGAATVKIAQATGVTLTSVSEEQAVGDVLAKVESGEADAGLVYSTDVIAARDKVLGIPFPEAAKAVNTNSIVALKNGPQAALGQQFVDLVLSADGQTVLADAGFGAAG
jgi:molybdate transport system substrate-binding protein